MSSKIETIIQKIKTQVPLVKNFQEYEIKNKIIEEVIKESEKEFIPENEKKEIITKVFNQMIKYGKIQEYLDDEFVTEIMINGPLEVFIEKNNVIEKVDVTFSEEELEDMICKMVLTINRSVNQAVPIVDARLKDGSRVNIVLKPIALNGPIITIRKFLKEVLNIEELIRNETVNKEVADFLRYIVERKMNIFISGGTGSGKTTLLNILSNFINENERVITIEDSAELKIKNIKNIVKLETRNKNSEGYGEITIRDLIRSSLRMRPDRIIVGEVRGKETLDMLQAMNTGHDGSLSTGHANSAQDMLTRLESMVLMNYDIPIEAVKRQIASALDIIIHISKHKGGKRKIDEILEVIDYEGGKYVTNVIYKRNSKGELIKKNELINRYKYEYICDCDKKTC